MPKRQTHLVLYDDHCSFCTFQMRVITWLDWLNRVSLIPMSHPESMTLAPGLTPASLQEAIHCITPGGRVYRGARGIRFLSARLPLAWPMAVVLWIPGVIWIAEIIYKWISRNRYLLSRFFGCQGACNVMPVRDRVNERAYDAPPPTPRV